MNPRIKRPSEGEKREMLGRMYQAIDIERGITQGHFKTVDEIKAFVLMATKGLSLMQDMETWVINEHDRIDVTATLAHNGCNADIFGPKH